MYSVQKDCRTISDLSGQNISEGTVQNILKENSGKADCAYEEIRKSLHIRRGTVDYLSRKRNTRDITRKLQSCTNPLIIKDA